jgi:hypothetical protein
MSHFGEKHSLSKGTNSKSTRLPVGRVEMFIEIFEPLLKCRIWSVSVSPELCTVYLQSTN